MILGLIFGLVLMGELALIGYGILWLCGVFKDYGKEPLCIHDGRRL